MTQAHAAWLERLGPLVIPLVTGACAGPSDAPLRVVTFNTGTTPGLAHDASPDDGYGSAEAELSDTWYGDGLAWRATVAATAAWVESVDPDVIAVQEMFWSGACPEIPAEAHAGFVCEDWSPGDPSVIEQVLGTGWAIGCHPGKSDKCVAVHERVGRLRGCDEGLCLDALDGADVTGCGTGARVARAVIERGDGTSLTLAHIHGSSGLGEDEQACRVAQVEQVFLDLDGEPALPESGIVLGDLNTDPGRLADADPSAARWNDFVGAEHPVQWVTAMGPDALPTYQGLISIDHVAASGWSGACWSAGLEGHAPVWDGTYFDHHPVVCDVQPTD